MEKREDIFESTILEEEETLTLGELCTACAVRAVCIVELVEEGVLDPVGREPGQWRFSGASLLRAQTALRLQRDLTLNLPGVALVLDLLDEIDRLKLHTRQLERY